jgi:hypothetical protein
MSAALTVTPQTGRLESVVIAFLTTAVVALTYLYASLQPEEQAPPPLLEWQRSAFSDLGTVDQSIHSALLSAVPEIYWYQYRLTDWPDIPDLEDEVLPPFYKDAFWEANGSVQWRLGLPLSNDQGTTYYHGSGGTEPGQSSYLLVLGHIHAGMLYSNQNTIWVHPDPNTEFPEITKPESLVRAGWRQVVPYSGADEVERLRGAGA